VLFRSIPSPVPTNINAIYDPDLSCINVSFTPPDLSNYSRGFVNGYSVTAGIEKTGIFRNYSPIFFEGNVSSFKIKVITYMPYIKITPNIPFSGNIIPEVIKVNVPNSYIIPKLELGLKEDVNIEFSHLHSKNLIITSFWIPNGDTLGNSSIGGNILVDIAPTIYEWEGRHAEVVPTNYTYRIYLLKSNGKFFVDKTGNLVFFNLTGTRTQFSISAGITNIQILGHSPQGGIKSQPVNITPYPYSGYGYPAPYSIYKSNI
jgi:hypothetical protein